MGTVTNKYLECYESISKLIKSGYLEVKLNDDSPCVFLSLACYRAFFCDQGGIFIDEQRASAFLDKVRFYVNMTRAWASGMVDGTKDASGEALETGVEGSPTESGRTGADGSGKWKYPPLEEGAWINIYVATSDEKGILIYGRFNDKDLELKPYKADNKATM